MKTYYVTVEIELQATSPQEVREIITTRLATIADRFIVGDVEQKGGDDG